MVISDVIVQLSGVSEDPLANKSFSHHRAL